LANKLKRRVTLLDARLWIMELIRLRINDLDLECGIVTIHSGKGGKDRVMVMPDGLKDGLAAH